MCWKPCKGPVGLRVCVWPNNINGPRDGPSHQRCPEMDQDTTRQPAAARYLQELAECRRRGMTLVEVASSPQVWPPSLPISVPRGQLKVWAARRRGFVGWQSHELPSCWHEHLGVPLELQVRWGPSWSPCLFLCLSLVLALRWEQAADTYLGDQAGPVRGQGFQILLLRRFCFPLISLKGPDNEEWLIKQHRLLLGSAAPRLLCRTPSHRWGWGFESHT